MPVEIDKPFKIYFATNRRMNGNPEDPDFGDRCHADGPDFYRVGTATVEKKSDDLDEGYAVDPIIVKKEGKETDQEKEENEGKEEVKEEGKKEDRTPDQDKRGSDELFADIRRDVDSDPRDVLVYIHGFANKFKSAISRAAQLHEHYRIGPGEDAKHPLVFAFCWPSNGNVTPPWEYFSDRDDAREAGPAMARALLRFSDYMRRNGDPCEQRIHLVAHSMGNWALRHAVQALALLDSGSRLEPLFDNVLLMAADEDDDAFERNDKLKPLLKLARRIHVYHSSDDLSLVISDRLKFNPDRLGYDGPRDISKIDKRIISVDCENVDDTEVAHVNHQYYRRRPEVISDVRHVLAGMRPGSIPGRIEIQSGRHYRIQPTEEEPSAVLDTPKNPVKPRYHGHR